MISEIRRIERGRVAGDIDAGIVDASRPVEHARHFPARVAGAIACDLLNRFDKFVVVDPAIVGAGHGAQFQPAPRNGIVGFERLYLFGPVRGESVLQVDRRERCRKLTQIGRGRAYLACQLAEAPMGRRHRRVRAGQDQRQALGIVPVRLDVDQRTFDDAGAAAFGSTPHRAGQIAQRQKALIVGPREPL